MKLTVVSQLFYPELISTGLTLTELCEGLAKKGIKVTVIAGYPTIVDTKKRVPKRLIHKGIKIHRVWSTRFRKINIFGKTINHITFFLSIFFKLLLVSRSQHVLLLTNPPILPLIMLILAPIKRFRFSILLFDLYPETLVANHIFSPKHVLVRAWKVSNQLLYKRAQHIITIGQCMKEKVQLSLPKQHHSKIALIPIWSDDKHIQSTKFAIDFRSRWELQDYFVVGYSGNLARFHDIESILYAAKQCQSMKQIKFLFVGEGYKKTWAMTYVATHKLSNVMFKSYVDREHLGALLDLFDVGLVSLLPEQTGLSVPSKTMGLLAAGCPIIALMDPQCTISQLITTANNGYSIRPHDVSGLTKAISTLANDPILCDTFGQRSLALSAQTYNLNKTCDTFKHILF